jgi:hypothetical protein
MLRWIEEMPEAFRAEPVGVPGGRIPIQAVAADLYETYYGEPPDEAFLGAFRCPNPDTRQRNRLRWVLACCHLLWHPALRSRPLHAGSLRGLLLQEMTSLAEVVSVESLRAEELRREELIRRTLRAFGVLLPGETPKEAEDRLTQLDSIEHRRLIRDAADRERRAREVREMMARRAAEEAAAKVSRE